MVPKKSQQGVGCFLQLDVAGFPFVSKFHASVVLKRADCIKLDKFGPFFTDLGAGEIAAGG
jgi:hypothetical protein